MDIDDTPEEALYRDEVRNWLAQNAPPFLITDAMRSPYPNANLTEALAWHRRKAQAGYAGISAPVTLGGQGRSAGMQYIFLEEEACHRLPNCAAISSVIELMLPVLETYASPPLCHLAKRLIMGEDLWCSLLSEPSAGSDIAGLRTRATRDGDHWIIDGQKTWNSGAHYADWGFIVVRTDPDVPKHKGLSCFVLDMKTPGITVKPIRQVSGEPEFNDVFFDQVRVPAENMLGAPNEGWKTLILNLTSERTGIATMPAFIDDYYEDLFALAGKPSRGGSRPLDRETVRSKLASWYVSGEGARLYFRRVMTRLDRGIVPGPETALCKLVFGRREYEMASYAMDLIGAEALEQDGDDRDGIARMHSEFLYSFGGRIGGGTDDILRNILAESVLGMPPEIRLDKNQPFKTAS